MQLSYSWLTIIIYIIIIIIIYIIIIISSSSIGVINIINIHISCIVVDIKMAYICIAIIINSSILFANTILFFKLWRML